MEVKLKLNLFLLQCLLSFSIAQSFYFFYFVQQWSGSFCDTAKSCFYPTDGKPASELGIHGLRPNNNDGTYPSNYDSSNPFYQSKISDLVSRMQQNWPTLACPSSSGAAFWSHEWDKHGTCSGSVLDQHGYFKSALDLKADLDILSILQGAGIGPDGGSYRLSSIKDALKSGIGAIPWIECNNDSSGKSQLYQVYICVDSSGYGVIECPVFPHGKCSSDVGFPLF